MVVAYDRRNMTVGVGVRVGKGYGRGRVVVR